MTDDNRSSEDTFSLATANTSDASTIVESYQRPFDEVTVWITAVITFTMLVIGVISNTVTMATILKYKALRNLFVYFIFSLCVSDLFSAMISPLWWYRRTLGFDDWPLPNFFCKLYWAGDIMTSFATSLHIVAFAIFRLMSIRSPHLFARIRDGIGIVCVLIIWIVTFTCSFVPFYIWCGARKRDRQSDAPDAKWPSCTLLKEWFKSFILYQKTGFTMFLLVPMVFILFVSILSCLQVFAATHSSVAKRNERQKRKEKQAILQLTLIVASFLFAYIPFVAYGYWAIAEREITNYTRRVDYYFGVAQYMMQRFSECMNPVFYNVGSTKMRKHTKAFLRGIFGNAATQGNGASLTPTVLHGTSN